MNKLQLPHAKLFYAVGEAYRKRMIDETEKRILKEKIITDNVEVFEILEQADNQQLLLEKLASIVRSSEPEIVEVPVQPQEMVVSPPVAEEEASSPWGQFLRRKKMNTHHQHKNEVHNIKNLIKPEKAE